MMTMPKPRTPPPPRPGWNYDAYFLAQLAKAKEQKLLQ